MYKSVLFLFFCPSRLVTYLLPGHEQDILESIFPEFLSKEARDAIMGFLPGRRFDLLYRASLDGWSVADFHRLCVGQGPTVTIFTTDQGYIFGGYAQQPWISGYYDSCIADANAFLFSVKRPGGLGPTKLELVAGRHDHALRISPSLGPAFGDTSQALVCSQPNGSAYVMIGGRSVYQWPGGASPGNFFTRSTPCVLAEVVVFKVTAQ